MMFPSKVSDFTWEVNTYPNDAIIIQVLFKTPLFRNNIKEGNKV